MKHLKRTITSICIILSTLTVVAQQKALNSQQALKKYDSISAIMNKAFPESEYKTFTRASFSETQLETYLKQHFERLDLLKILVNEHKTLKLDGYLHSGNLFGGIGFTKESIKSYKAFFDYYKSIENELTEAEINYYIKNYKPFDKAGSYGIQEWIGIIGITKIEGSYTNVVGLPVEKVYTKLLEYAKIH